MTLPPLPEPGYHVWAWDHEVDAFTADQLRAYGLACARAAAEEMRDAKIAEEAGILCTETKNS